MLSSYRSESSPTDLSKMNKCSYMLGYFETDRKDDIIPTAIGSSPEGLLMMFGISRRNCKRPEGQGCDTTRKEEHEVHRTNANCIERGRKVKPFLS